MRQDCKPFGHLWVNLAQCIRDTSWRWTAGQTAGGSTGLQITGGLQSAAIVFLHTCIHAQQLF